MKHQPLVIRYNHIGAFLDKHLALGRVSAADSYRTGTDWHSVDEWQHDLAVDAYRQPGDFVLQVGQEVTVKTVGMTTITRGTITTMRMVDVTESPEHRPTFAAPFDILLESHFVDGRAWLIHVDTGMA